MIKQFYTSKEYETNPDYYCYNCRSDNETGGQPALCDDCRQEREE